MSRHRFAIGVATAALVGTACSSVNPDPRVETAATTTVPSSDTTLGRSTTAVTATSTTSVRGTRPVTLAFAGDVYAQGVVGAQLAAGTNPLAPIAEVIGGADVAVVNLETAVTTASKAYPKTFTFKAPTSLLTALRSAGVDMVTVANNHSWDYYEQGFRDTLAAADAAGLTVIGGGIDEAEAYTPDVVDVGGLRVAIIGAARVGPGPDGGGGSGDGYAAGTTPGVVDGKDAERLAALVRTARSTADAVIVVIHMGTELEQCPQPDEQALVRTLFDAGAVAVVGHHPHVLQGVDTSVAGHLAAYSMGNFVWGASKTVTRTTGVLTITLAPDGTLAGHTFTPALINRAGSPVPVTGDAATAARAAYDALAVGGSRCPAA